MEKYICMKTIVKKLRKNELYCLKVFKYEVI